VRRLAAGIVASAVLAGCAVPRHRATAIVDEPATSYGGASAILVHFNTVRRQADAARSPRILAGVEGGAALTADVSLYRVSARLHPRRHGARRPWTSPSQLFVPRFTRYPLWFVAVVEDTGRGTRVAAVLARASVTTPWRVVLAPQLVATTPLPAVRTVRGGQVAVPMTDRGGLARSPAATVDRYCRVLADPRSRYVGDFSADSFIPQMRRVQSRARAPRVIQRWARMPGGYALRTASGGALVFASVRRQDRYRFGPRQAFRWPRSNPAAAYQPGRVRRSATVTYLYQLLMYVPARGGGGSRVLGGGGPRVLGVAGGLIGARSP
jgi:hypothetical protein